jgi:proline iminopeptidase
MKEGFIAVPGGRVWYGVEGSSGATPLIVIHGGPGTPHNYLKPHAALGVERPVIFYDQLGCGKSEQPDNPALWRLPRFVEELAALVAALKLERFHLLGHSWGSIVAVQYLWSRRDGVASLILSSPVLSFPRYAAHGGRLRASISPEAQAVLDRAEAEDNFESREAQLATMEYYSRYFCRLDPWPECLLETLTGFGRQVYQTMQGPTEFVVTGNLRAYDCTARLGSISVPTLVTCGRHDLSDPKAALADQRAIPGSEIAIFEQSSHMPHLEETESYLKTVRGFLARSEHCSGLFC